MCAKTSKDVSLQTLAVSEDFATLFVCKFGAVALLATVYPKHSAQALGVAVGLAVAVACWGWKRLFIHNGVITTWNLWKSIITARYVNIAWGSLGLARGLQLFVFLRGYMERTKILLADFCVWNERWMMQKTICCNSLGCRKVQGWW
ncbi:membrane hypothetical protein [Tenacibaculum ascidiaceicola]